MTIRDRSVVAALSVVLVILVGVQLGQSLAPAGSAASLPPTARPVRGYVEGMLGRAADVSPFGARSAADRSLVALVFRGLVRLGPGDTILPDLATRWETDATGSTWTFHLRDGVTWQDGAPLTAADVVFTLSALADPAYAGPDGESWREVVASSPDPSTVVLHLATPLGGFLQAATQPIAPRHLLGGVAVSALATDPFGTAPVGSGAFRLVSLTDQAAVLEAWVPPAAGADPPTGPAGPAGSHVPIGDFPADPTRFVPGGPRPYLPRMEFRFYADLPSLRAAWASGALDAASGLAPDAAEALATAPGSRVVRYPGTTLFPVVLDLRPAHPEFRDPAVRRALLQAIDRDAIVAGPLAGFGVRADGLIPPGSAMFDATASARVSADPTAAAAALTKAGWKKSGTGWTPKGASGPLTIDLLSPDAGVNPSAFAVADAVAADWKAIGLTVVHTALPAAELMSEHVRTGAFSAVVVPLVLGLDPDLYPLLASTQTTSGGTNLSGVQDAALDKLLIAARAPGPEAARKAAYSALQQRLAAYQYVLPIAFRDEVVVLRDTVVGPSQRLVGGPGDRFWDVLTWRLADGR